MKHKLNTSKWAIKNLFYKIVHSQISSFFNKLLA